MSSRQYLTDAATRHQVFLQRYGGGQSKNAQVVLDRLRRTINGRLMQEPTEFRRNRLTAVLADIENLSRDAFGQIARSTVSGAQDLARTEVAFSAQLYNRGSVGVDWTLPSDTTLITTVMGTPMPVAVNASVTIDEAFRQFTTKKTASISQTISDGVTLGDTTPEIARNLGTQIDTLNRRQLDTLVRTVTNNTASVARNVMYEENAELMDGYQWISTLDNRTTFICGSRDRKIYQVNSGPMPPAHWGCRSTTIPKVKPEYDLGATMQDTRPYVGQDGEKGTISGNTGYGGWLKKQPVEFVDEALGVERSRLFRSGKLTMDKFVDPTGRVYTLNELERMNPFVFMDSTIG